MYSRERREVEGDSKEDDFLQKGRFVQFCLVSKGRFMQFCLVSKGRFVQFCLVSKGRFVQFCLVSKNGVLKKVNKALRLWAVCNNEKYSITFKLFNDEFCYFQLLFLLRKSLLYRYNNWKLSILIFRLKNKDLSIIFVETKVKRVLFWTSHVTYMADHFRIC